MTLTLSPLWLGPMISIMSQPPIQSTYYLWDSGWYAWHVPSNCIFTYLNIIFKLFHADVVISLTAVKELGQKVTMNKPDRNFLGYIIACTKAPGSQDSNSANSSYRQVEKYRREICQTWFHNILDDQNIWYPKKGIVRSNFHSILQPRYLFTLFTNLLRTFPTWLHRVLRAAFHNLSRIVDSYLWW